MNANDIIEKCAEICDQSAKELDDGRSFYNVAIKVLRESAADIRALKSSLPAETVSEAMVELACKAFSPDLFSATRGHIALQLRNIPSISNLEDTRNYERKRMRAALEAAALAAADDGWRPIESAPKEWFNGDLILARLWKFNKPNTEYAYSIARFEKGSWVEDATDDVIYNPIALMPLIPVPPKDGRE